jgi:hypothetical protein
MFKHFFMLAFAAAASLLMMTTPEYFREFIPLWMLTYIYSLLASKEIKRENDYVN